jgi:predicted metal-dependent phosphotriesterase family hydrolase
MVGNPFFVDEQPDYLHITNTILPRLLEAGVTQEQIDLMLVDNPRRFWGERTAGSG